jgi:hypothetical protein
MRKQLIYGVKIAWTVAALVALVLYLGGCSSGDQACRPIGETMLFFMGVITFPAGLICIIVSVIVCGLVGGEYPRSEFTIWLLLVCGGCLQWYIVVPMLLEERRFTLLNLHTTLPISKGIETSAVQPNPSIETSPTVSQPVIPTPRKPRARKRHNRVVAFDKFGRSPLERVINQHARDASA